jgi:hypothetical protein
VEQSASSLAVDNVVNGVVAPRDPVAENSGATLRRGRCKAPQSFAAAVIGVDEYGIGARI